MKYLHTLDPDQLEKLTTPEEEQEQAQTIPSLESILDSVFPIMF